MVSVAHVHERRQVDGRGRRSRRSQIGVAVAVHVGRGWQNVLCGGGALVVQVRGDRVAAVVVVPGGRGGRHGRRRGVATTRMVCCNFIPHKFFKKLEAVQEN